jgi:hypothetical protein
MSLVFDRPFDRVDDEHLYRALGRFEFQPELFLDRREEVGGALIRLGTGGPSPSCLATGQMGFAHQPFNSKTCWAGSSKGGLASRLPFLASHFTARRRPVAVVHSETFMTREAALNRERQIKGLSRAASAHVHMFSNA